MTKAEEFLSKHRTNNNDGIISHDSIITLMEEYHQEQLKESVKLFSRIDMCDFAAWYERKQYNGEFTKYNHPINGKKDIESVKDLVDLWEKDLNTYINKP